MSLYFETIQDMTIVTIEDECEFLLTCDLSNGAISNDLERSTFKVTPIFKAEYVSNGTR